MALFSKTKSDHAVNKSFNYTRGGTNLSFVLRIDIKEQLENFEALLEEALVDIKDELVKHKKTGYLGSVFGGGAG